MTKRKNFITTTSKEVADELKKHGFQLVSEDGNKWTFVNDKTINFNNANSNKVVYTDILSM